MKSGTILFMKLDDISLVHPNNRYRQIARANLYNFCCKCITIRRSAQKQIRSKRGWPIRLVLFKVLSCRFPANRLTISSGIQKTLDRSFKGLSNDMCLHLISSTIEQVTAEFGERLRTTCFTVDLLKKNKQIKRKRAINRKKMVESVSMRPLYIPR